MTTTITGDDIIRRYAANVAYVAESDPATDLDTFISQLDTVAGHFRDAGINGWEDLEGAATLLVEARDADDETDRGVFLRRANEYLTYLTYLTDTAEEIRDMVGG